MHGIIPTLPEGQDPVIMQPMVDSDPAWRLSLDIWNLQMQFDERLHADRRLTYPQDVEGAARDQNQAMWSWGLAFALLSELDELNDAIEEGNWAEEVVDVLHFTTSLAIKLKGNLHAFGRLEDRFEKANDHRLHLEADDPEGVYRAVLPDFVKALNGIIQNYWKWWKNHDSFDIEAVWDGLLDVEHCNMIIASSVFDSAEAMHGAYMAKNAENHERQEGTVTGREDYIAP